MSKDPDPPTLDVTPSPDAQPGALARARGRLTRLTARPARLLDRAPGARALLERAADKTRQLADRLPIQQAAEAALMALTDPRTAQLLQAGMTAMGNVGMEATFRRDPQARLLFEFADWCADAAGREAVMLIIMQDALSPHGGFHQLASPILSLGASDPLSAFAATASHANVPGRTLNLAHAGMLRTLCAMADLACDQPPPPRHATPPALASHLRDSQIPERFKPLALMALGEEAPASTPNAAPEGRPDPGSEHPQAPSDGAPSRGSSAASEALERPRSLLPALSLSPAHRFLLGPYLVFLQTWLTRNMVDALPAFMARIRQTAEAELRRDDPAEAPTPDDIIKG